MKQILQQFTLRASLIVMLLIGAVGSAWGKTTDTIIFSELNLENGVQYTEPFDGGDFTVTFAGGTNDGKYYTTGSGIRVYGDGTMTIASENNIVSISFTYDGSYKPTTNNVANVGTYNSSTDTWTGNATSVIFTRPSGSGHWRVKTIAVTYDDGTVDNREEVILSFPAESYNATIGKDFTSPQVTADPSAAISEVTYSSSNTKAATIDENGIVTLIDAGTTTITASITNSESYKDAIASYTLNVTKTLTIEDGIFNFEAKNLDYDSGVETTTDGSFYIEEDKTWTAGKVTLVSSGKYRWWDNDGTLRFYNAVGSGMTISVPNGYVITSIVITGGQAFAANVGEYASGTWTGSAQSVTLAYAASSGSVNVRTVTVTYEEGTAEKIDPTITIGATELEVGETTDITTNGPTLTISSDDPDVVSVDGTTLTAESEGSAVITVSWNEDATFNAGSMTFDITVTEAQVETDGITLDFNGLYTETQPITEVTVDGITATFDKASGSTAPAWNLNSNEARLYAGNRLTISSANNRIIKVVYTYNVNANKNGVAPTLESVLGSTSDGTWNNETTTWTGADQSVTMTLGGTAGNFGFKRIVVYLEEGATKVTPTVEISSTDLEIGGTAEVTTNGPALTVTSDNPDVVSVSATTLTAESAGTAVITATWEETEEYYGGSKNFTVTVVDSDIPGSTIENPLTVAQVLDLFANGNVPTTEVYVQGIVSEIKSLDVSKYTRAQYYISDNGSKDNQFYVFNGLYLNGANFTSNDQLQEGDEVIILGTLTTYNGTNEFAANNKIVSFNRPVVAVEKPVFSVEAGSFTEAQSVEITCATEGATIYYTTDGSEPTAESTEYTGAIAISETTTLKAIAIKGEDQSIVAEATYMILSIKDGVFDFVSMFSDYGSGLQPILVSNEYVYEDKTWTAVNVTLISSGKYRWWKNGGELRFYKTDNDENATKASSMTISVPEGKVITKIVVTGGTSFTADCGTYDAGTWTGSSQTVILTLDGTAAQNVETVTVTYKSTTPSIEGDVNKDGKLTIADVTALVNIILGHPGEDVDMDAANVNGDDKVTIADVTALVNKILKQ